MLGSQSISSPLRVGAGVAAGLTAALALTVTKPFGSSVTPPAGAPSTARCPEQTAPPDQVSVTGYRQAIVCLVNHERTSRGLRPVSGDVRLARAAGGHASDMDARNYWSHTSPSGSTPASRAYRSHYLPGDGRWKVGEDLAWGRGDDGSPRALVAAWMNSPPHRHELLTPGYRDIGVGASRGSPRGTGESGAITLVANLGHR